MYCELFNADYYAKKHYEGLKAWYMGDNIKKCNTEARTDYNCFNTYMQADDLEEFVYYKRMTD